MEKYNPKTIESKWQKYWEDHPELSQADEKSKKPKFYCLDMFPYPSGDGLHVGHVENYTATDIYSRYLRMNGKNVLHPVGWDAFGLPAENYAIKMGIHPRKQTQENIKNFTRQIKSIGASYDWSREIDTSSSEYYKWTQWFFLFLYKNGLAYRKKAKVNWCESCKTVLANEQVEDGRCERCKKEVVQKDLEQWFFKITDFAEDLIKDLDKVDWPRSTKIAQRNWIGRSVGAIIKFSLSGTKLPSEKSIEVFTTRLDTIYGCTYCVIAPENGLIQNLKDKISNWKDVEKYIAEAKKKTDLQRTDLAKEKTGVELKGVKVINPFTNEELPVFVADYVLSTYGTGAVMAVSAHDERDWEFAKKYKLPIKQAIAPLVIGEDEDTPIQSEKRNERKVIVAVVKHWEEDKYLCLDWGEFGWKSFVIGGIEKGETGEEAALREAQEETGYQNLKFIKQIGGEVHANFNARHKKIGNRYIKEGCYLIQLENEKHVDPEAEHTKNHKYLWLEKDEVSKFLNISHHSYYWDTFINGEKAFTDDGILVNSEKYSGLTSEKAREKMVKWLEENNLGVRKITYKLRDWLISRQRYWGSPIPMIFCEKCGWQMVPEKDLPVLLPDVKDYRPKGTSPLGTNLDFVNTACPECGGKAKRETDTMDTFVCSSWYFFRFADPKNEKEFASSARIKKWLPVDMYMGGAEHTVLHLMYSRFFTKALYRHKLIDFDEPFTKLRHQGMVLAEDGRKMSKSLGNVINPDEIVRKYGADTLRLYEMFMGPLEETKAWNTKSIVGLKRFLDRVWKLSEKRKAKSEKPQLKTQNLGSSVHKTIKKVTEDVDNFRFNTAISAMMILLNELEKEKEIYPIHYTLYIILLGPFAPHIAEEIWQQLGNKNSIFLEKWPQYDKKLIKDEEITLIIQVNGKVRDQIKMAADISEDEAKKLALESEKLKNYIGEKDVRKIIFVPNRLINFVI
jgi:leucyl-tRNA synthetase